MIDFDEFIIMKEGFLQRLNIAVDRIIQEKKSMNLNYEYIEKALKAMIKNRNVNTNAIHVVTQVKKEEILKITLEFFKSVEPELYKRAVNIILGQEKDIKMNVYNVHSINNFIKRDKEGFLEYTPYGVAQTREGRALINIPTNVELNKKEDRIINKDDCTLDDLYTVVHEIAHLFDFNLDIEKATKKEIAGEQEVYEDNITRELTAEATTIAFEGLLSEYLLENKLYPKSAIQQMSNRRINSCLQKARMVYAKLILAREKEEKGEITSEFIEKSMRDYNLSIQGVRHIASDIINSPRDMLIQNRYAIGGLLAPTIIKTYKMKGKETLQRYLEETKKCNLESALKQLGIQLNNEGIEETIKNFQEYMQLHSLDMDER